MIQPSVPGPDSPLLLDRFVHWAAAGMEALGVAVIVAGILGVGARFAWRAATRGLDPAYHAARANLGRAILLGLELLVAGDIIRTVTVEPSLESVAVLAVIVLIRTLLSFSLQVEIDGRWPWQTRPAGERGQGKI